jgi:hypothetical protein
MQVGTYTNLGKLIILGLILLVSYFLVEMMLVFESLVPSILGVADTSGSALYNASIYLLTITTIMFIGVMFTVPLALSLVGRVDQARDV